ncbi:MAG: hypothetical protein H6604_08150 [Flavobacteriales bacterium]|nr:hypothetical protein [Flavobacteriales bacterium]
MSNFSTVFLVLMVVYSCNYPSRYKSKSITKKEASYSYYDNQGKEKYVVQDTGVVIHDMSEHGLAYFYSYTKKGKDKEALLLFNRTEKDWDVIKLLVDKVNIDTLCRIDNDFLDFYKGRRYFKALPVSIEYSGGYFVRKVKCSNYKNKLKFKRGLYLTKIEPLDVKERDLFARIKDTITPITSNPYAVYPDSLE